MQVIARVNEPVELTYTAKKHTTGLVDVTAEILDETRSKDIVNFPDIVLTELTDFPGTYYGSFTPDATGVWTVKVDSVTKKGPVEFTYIVTNANLESIGTTLDAVQAVVDDLSDPPALV